MEQKLKRKNRLLLTLLIIAVVIILLLPFFYYLRYSLVGPAIPAWKFNLLRYIFAYDLRYRDYLIEEYGSFKSCVTKSANKIYEYPEIVQVDMLINNEFEHKALFKLSNTQLTFIEHDTSWYYVSDKNKNVEELISKIYTDEELSLISNEQLNVKSFDKKYKIECMRYRNGSFNAIYMSPNEILCVVFDENGSFLYSKKYSKQIDYSKYVSLKNGDNIDELFNSIQPKQREKVTTEYYTMDNKYITMESFFDGDKWYCISCNIVTI